MSHSKGFLGLPTLALNLISSGVVFVLVCLGLKTIQSSDVALRVANTQLVTSTSASRLESLAAELDERAKLIKEKDLAYQQLSEIYQESLKGKEGYGRLQTAIETVETLPPVENIETIQAEIETTGAILKEISLE